MEVLVLNTEFEAVGVIDSYISLIWTDRYNESGDFELLLPMGTPATNLVKEDYYLLINESEHVMFVEDIYITTDVEEGSRMKVVGHSIEQMLDRRVVWNKTTFKKTYNGDTTEVVSTPNLQDSIEQLIKDNITAPTIPVRKIDNFVFEKSTDETITALTLEAQYHGETIYDIVNSLCAEHRIGFKMVLNESNQFVFKLYAGADRTYDQLTNPYVVFSPSNDNLFNSSYCRIKSTFKNVALVIGEDSEDESKSDYDKQWEYGSNDTGLARREVCADGSDISTTDDDGDLSVLQYRALLKQRCIDTLIDNLEYEAFDGEVETTIMYKYGEDFFMGDYVQLEDAYGHQGQAYISEFIISQDTSGISMYPTFITLQEGEYDT